MHYIVRVYTEYDLYFIVSSELENVSYAIIKIIRILVF